MTNDQRSELRKLASEATPTGLIGRECAPGYEVTADGRVFSTKSNWRGYGVRQLRATKNSGGYASVRMIVDGRRLHKPVHILVAAAYMEPKPSPLHQLRHLDGDSLNPALTNLAWGTAKDNADDRDRHGTTARGSRNGVAKLTEDSTADIRRMHNDGMKQYEIADKLGVSRKTVSNVLLDKLWRHVKSREEQP